jgi:hypothetical protein
MSLKMVKATSDEVAARLRERYNERRRDDFGKVVMDGDGW